MDKREQLVHELEDVLGKLSKEHCSQPSHPKRNLPRDFLFVKRDRYTPHMDTVPFITHIPIIEVRPTSDYRNTKNMVT